MNNVKCPVCGGTSLIAVNYSIAPGSGGGYWTLVPLGMFSAVHTNRYVCKSCGYLMEFFSKEDVEKLNNKYGK